MRSMVNIILSLSLLLCPACDDAKEYLWNDSWNETEQDVPETPTEPDEPQQPDEPSEPEGPQEPVEPSDPEVPEEPIDPEVPEDPVEPEIPEEPVVPEPPVEPEVPEDPIPEGWSNVSASYGELPSYIRILKSPSELQGKKVVAYVAEADMNEAEWDVWSVKIKEQATLTEETNDAFRTPSQVYADESFPVIINGGYFYYSGNKRYTASLAFRDSRPLAYNIGYESDGGKQYLPARAVFRESVNGGFDACWTYVNWDYTHYMYKAPSDKPTQKPSADFPAGAEKFEAVTAIGGGPVLINEGEIVNTYVEEVFYGISPDTDQPRTAIGITSDNKMVFFVCEGRGMTKGVYGMTTEDVAEVLLSLGCVEAINLDGGGSSCMLVNGKETISVSDGNQRSVASTVMLK